MSSLHCELFRVRIRLLRKSRNVGVQQMHCPRCGQQQVSSETKFCSRCGFQLAIVSELILHGGTLPQLAELHKKRTFFNKKNGVVFSAIWFIFFTMFMTSVWGILGADELAGL